MPAIAWAITKFVATLVASYVLNQILAPQQKDTTPDAASSEDFKMPQINEGTPQCVFFGDCWTEDWFVLSYGNYRYEAIQK